MGMMDSIGKLYHGGAPGLSRLSVSKAGSNAWPTEKAIWLTPSKKEAGYFAGQLPNGQVYEVPFSPKNPLDVPFKDWWQTGVAGANPKKAEIINKAKDMGHDSVIFRDNPAFTDIRPAQDEVAVLNDVNLLKTLAAMGVVGGSAFVSPDRANAEALQEPSFDPTILLSGPARLGGGMMNMGIDALMRYFTK